MTSIIDYDNMLIFYFSDSSIISCTKNTIKICSDKWSGNVYPDETISLKENFIRKNTFISCYVTFDEFQPFSFGRGIEYYAGYYIDIQKDSIYVHNISSEDRIIEKYEHNLTFLNTVFVSIDYTETNKAILSIHTELNKFTHEITWWAGGATFIKNYGKKDIKVQLNFQAKDILCPIWIIGDSYINWNSKERWPYYIYKACGSLEIERKHHHVGRGAIHALREDELRGVAQVAAVLLQDVAQAEAEFQFGYELEEGQVEVAPQAHLDGHVEGLRAQLGLLGRREVVHGHHARHDVGAVVVETRGTDLQVEGQGHVGRAKVLRVGLARGRVAKGDVFRAEMERRDEAQAQIGVHLPFAQHAHAEPEAHAVLHGQPLRSRGGIDVAVVLQAQALVVNAHGEAIVEAPLVDERLVLHLALLGAGRKGAAHGGHQAAQACRPPQEGGCVERFHRRHGAIPLYYNSPRAVLLRGEAKFSRRLV